MSDDPPSPNDIPDQSPAEADVAAGKSHRRRESKFKREAREESQFWCDCLATDIGRRALWRMLFSGNSGHPFETRFPAGAVGFPDPNAAWYSRGEQDFALRLFHGLQRIDPHGTLAMQFENDVRFADAKPQDPKPAGE
jgi:hypothetical protein